MSQNKSNTPSGASQQGTSAHPLDRYTTQPQAGSDQGDKSPYYHSAAPTLSLPKGGGALKGIDEKFSVNAVNGTAGLSVPLPLTPGRSGFTPSLSLSYNSGAGNSEFGLGWGLSLPAIQRKTDKKLPRYNDADESDVFLLAGAEDLVPLLIENQDTGEWLPDERIENIAIHEEGAPALTTATCLIKRYRPRIEGLFARIEHIRKLGGASWWRVTTKDNITTWYGLSQGGRLSAPDDAHRIFKWMPELVVDHKGNMQFYEYKAENFEQVPTALHERNRYNNLELCTNLYLKRVSYCNRTPRPTDTDTPLAPSLPTVKTDFLMELVLNYGELDDTLNSAYPDATTNEARSWRGRSDAFSDFHAGFEIRTYRRCQRALMYHRFDELAGGTPVLVRSLELDWKNGPYQETDALTEADFIVQVTETGYKQGTDGTVHTKSLPSINMEYQPLQWNSELKTVSADDALQAPQGLTGGYQWTDLWGEGLPGILTEQGQSWWYKRNLGDGHFSHALPVAQKPSFSGLASGALQWQDLDADGGRQIVSRQPGAEGFFELDDAQRWQDFRPFKKRVNVDWNSPYTKMLDLNGDGRPDLLITNDVVWTWYENEGKKGFSEGRQVSTVYDEEKGPRLVLNDAVQSIFLADMNGDGMTDIVRIKNGEVCYWPNKGYGRFGAKIAMSNAPTFAHPDLFNPLYLQLTDISGTGAPDLVYLGDSTFKVWVNLAGNGFSEAHEIATLPGMEAYSKVALLDFLGNGTGCIVWSSPLPQHGHAPLRYIDLMGGKKPYLMHTYHNGMGKRVAVTYRSSTQYYLEDKTAGTPWATLLPFPVQCIDTITTADTVSGTTYTQSYRYHHGYYDHEEREFRGFGRVDTLDTDTAALGMPNPQSPIPNSLNQSPVLTKTWYHTGAWMRESTLLDAYRKEYFRFDGWDELDTQATFPAGLSPREEREAHRALKGSALRQEVYAQDGLPESACPYTVTVSAYAVQTIQPSLLLWGGSGHAAFLTYGSESLAWSCERNPTDARLAHSLTLEVDEYGNVLQSAQVAYPRIAADANLPQVVQDEQGKIHITWSMQSYTHDVLSPHAHRLRLPHEAISYELTGNSLRQTTLFKKAGLLGHFNAATVLDATALPDLTIVQKRLLSHTQTLYRSDDTLQVLAPGVLESLAIPHEQYALAFLPDMLTEYYLPGTVTAAMLANEAGYVRIPGDPFNWWVPSGTVEYSTTPTQDFYSPHQFKDPWGNTTTITYWGNDWLLPASTTDALQNTSTITRYNWYHLQPEEMADANNNYSEVVFDALGMAVAMAVKGKGTGTEGDTLAGLDVDTKSLQDQFWNNMDQEAAAKEVLGGATWRCIYDPFSIPVRVAMIGRERHYADDADSPAIVRFTYTDGLGRVAMHKAQAADDLNGNRRWLAAGKTIYNNKGKAVMQYEPYYSNGPGYDGPASAVGVSPRIYYDPLGRAYRTELPDGSYTQTEWDGWKQTVYDANDTVLESDWYAAAMNGNPDQINAAQKAAVHAHTPAVMHLDSLGRPFYTIQHNKIADGNNGWQNDFLHSYEVLDLTGNRLAVHDATGKIPLTYQYNLLKAPCHQYSVDGSAGRMLMDVGGQPLWHTDAEDHIFTIAYDALRRTVAKQVTDTHGTRMTEKTVYADGPLANPSLNLRGKMTEHYDGSGKQYVSAYDFKGLPINSYQQLVSDYKLAEPNWLPGHEPALDPEVFETTAVVDALGRMITGTDAGGYMTRHTYDRGGQLTGVYMTRPGFAEETYVQDIHYDAKGQREAIWYGNNSKVVYTYDPQTYRLSRQATRRMTALSVWEDVQDVYYYYDAAGNITRIRDEAADVYFSGNTIVEPLKDYTYDALYRLVAASGREQVSNATYGTGDNYNDGIGIPNGNGLQNYTRYYDYDGAGNVRTESHVAVSGSFTRTYELVTGSNRLNSTSVNGATPYSYTYDARGNMTSMPHLSAMGWNTGSELSMVVAGVVNGFYQYSGGQRIRKTVEKDGFTEERIYLGSYERYRKYLNGNVDVERDTVHIADDTGRIAMLEQRVQGWDESEQVLKRFIYSNHLQSSALELDANGEIISYEEYHPYGTTAYQAKSATIKATAKRYRFTGKERDEESGLNYHGARYYAPWLCRWCAVDPLESKYVGWSAYHYGFCNPVKWNDPTGMGGNDPVEAPKIITGETANYNFVQNTYDYKGNLLSSNSQMFAGEINGLAHGQYQQDTRLPDPDRPVIRDGNLVVSNLPQTSAPIFTPYAKPEAGSTVWTRVGGGLKIVGGAIEMVAGAVGGAATAETGIGAVIGWAAVIHGADVTSAGMTQLFGGEEQQTLTQQGISAGLQTAGVSPQKANTAAAYGDMALSMALSIGTSTPPASTISAGKPLSDIPWIAKSSLPAEEEAAVNNIFTHIKDGTKPVGALAKKWGTKFGNRAGDLPGVPGAGGYLEYRVAPPPGVTGAGVRRIVTTTDLSQGFYTWTHYGDAGNPAFVRIW